MSKLVTIDKNYASWIEKISQRYKRSQIKAATHVNSEMLQFYWSLGKDIVTLKAESRWGEKFIANLSSDLKAKLPEVKGLSETNIGYAKRFYLLYSEWFTIHPQVGGGELQKSAIWKIPWGHHKYIIDKFEIKTGKFESEYIGQLGTYVAAVNHTLKKDIDNPSLGLLICKSKDNVLAQYALEASNLPIGISEYELSKLYPSDFKGTLPSIEDIEKELK